MRRTSSHLRFNGAAQALGAALLFGAAMPVTKLLVGQVDPWMLAGLLYIGSGLGLGTWRILTRQPWPSLAWKDIGWIAAAIVSGGMVAPVLLVFALARMNASSTSLLLNAEAVFTALLAWLVFREHIGRRIAFGMALIASGAVLLSWPVRGEAPPLAPAVLVLAACMAWAIDNNCTRRAAELDATWLAATKGLVAGLVNLTLALVMGGSLPSLAHMGFAMITGLVTYGLSLVLFVLALRHVGTARTGAYFSTAPFIGTVLALLGGEPADLRLLAAGLLMGIGVWLHLTERHEHEHEHQPMEHAHAHVHDEHHQHTHDELVNPNAPHTHAHGHVSQRHRHPHFPDTHHQHRH
jgi:drug/metabolite transporter (DMT)-like permease